MKLIINADDFGNSLHMSEIIVRCIQDGSLGSTSILVTASDVEQTLSKLLLSPEVRTSLHLNISEGKPLSAQDEIPYLIDAEGRFCRGYAWIVGNYYLGSLQRKIEIRQQIKHEYTLQIKRYTQLMQTNLINIDSHQHYHTIPFIVDVLIELSTELEVNIGYIRVPDEPFFIEISSHKDIKNYLGPNLIKHFLLKFLSRGLKRKLDKHCIPYNNSFIGVLFSGNMTLSSIRKALSRVQKDQIVEILLHPAALSTRESRSWEKDQFYVFYTHPNRKHEEEILLSQEFKILISS